MRSHSGIIRRKVIDFFKTIRLYKYYNFKNSISKILKKEEIIAMFDGKIIHGGISDRLWGILSIYLYCKDHNKIFKIFFNNPFKLQDYLVPNKVDWIISEKDLLYSLRYSQPLYISMQTHNNAKMYEIFKRKLKSISKRKQLHIYSNTRNFTKREFCRLYHDLFKMSPDLEKEYEFQRKEINSEYVSCTFRFQQLLGDFKEGKFRTIHDKKEKECLINNCKEAIVKLQNRCQCPVLVTSDSKTFLDYVSDLEGVYIVNGEVNHPDFNREDTSLKTYMKSFVDLYMIADAQEVYLCNVSPLYRSGFAETAACIYDKPYYEIRSFDDFEIVKWD